MKKILLLILFFSLSFTEYYDLNINDTGNSYIVVIQETINLEPGFEIGIFDYQAIINDANCNTEYGELLVGAGIWDGTQLNITTIGSIDFCDVGGVQRAGYVENNEIFIRVYNPSELTEYTTSFLTFSGIEPSFISGSITAISEIIIGDIFGLDYGYSGCTNPVACNYNPEATEEDGSCLNYDCSGECGGNTLVDECGVCGGNGIEEHFDCDGNCITEIDCLGICGGNSIIDECGICDGDNSTCVDCAGIPNGNAILDECDICNGNNDCLNYNVLISPTGINQLIILEETITNLEIGDEIGVFDLNGILPVSECNNISYGELLVGSGIWEGNQLQIMPIGSSEVSCIGGNSVLPGYIEGNFIEIRIWRNGTELFPEVEYLMGDGGFSIGLIEIISNLTFCNGIIDECGICNGDNQLCSGCTDLQADNYDLDAIFDNGICEFTPFVIENVEELEAYDSTVDIDLPEIVLAEITLDIDIPSGALNVDQGTEVTLEVSEASENQLQNIIDNSSSADAGIEVFQGISFNAFDEEDESIELIEGITLDVELTFESIRNEFNLGFITEEGEIIAFGTDCSDDGDGSWTCAGDGPGFGNYIIYLFDPTMIIEGCTLIDACNFGPDANINDGSCIWPSLLFDCDGNCNFENDCTGECGGFAELDECGVCLGGNSTCTDCFGIPNGDAVLDNCGTCDDDSLNDCVQDCAGTWGGSLILDECGECGGNNSSCSDCAGISNGNTEIDCVGECGGFAELDECGVCLGNNSSCSGCTDTTASNFNFEAIYDDGACIYPFTFTHNLLYGNNLISLPGDIDNNSSEDLLQQELDDQGINVVFMLGAGVGIFNTANGWSGNLNNVNKYSGYWLYVQDIGYNGVPSPYSWVLDYNSALEKCTIYENINIGNNLLSFKWGLGNASTMEALGGEDFATENFNFILGQGVGLFKTSTGWSGNLNQLEEGKGYWVNISNSDIDFKWGFDDCANPGNSSLAMETIQKPQMPKEFKFIQSTEQAFYLINDIMVDNEYPKSEDFILAYHDNILLGSAYYNTELTVLPVMGRDLSEQTVGFIEDGQVPTLKLYKSTTGEMINLDADLEGFSNLLVSEVALVIGSTVIIPTDYALHPAYPNPFNPVTNISYELPLDSQVILDVYDVEGRKIITLTEGIKAAGNHTIEWSAEGYPSGLYFIKLDASEFTQTQKLMLVK